MATIDRRRDLSYMQRAIELARQAASQGEIPIGAVIVYDDQIIGEGNNSNRAEANPTRHAEMKAIEMAAFELQNERLTGTTLYVTKEPCTMCAGAIIHARIERVVIGASDSKYGACGSKFSILGNEGYNHVPEIEFGLMADENTALLKEFFQRLRS